MSDFREQLYLNHLRVAGPSNIDDVEREGRATLAKWVQGEAEACCAAWGHEYAQYRTFEHPLTGAGYPQTLGGTPVVTNDLCRRCGHPRKPGESKHPQSP